MPNYNFKCKECGKTVNLLCKVSELDKKRPDMCECGGKMLQDFSGIGVTYNCGGFYTTDSKPNAHEFEE